jgi:L-ascorbate metabolism protein UlaG (beta-lactamase superfamily)
MPQKKHWCTMSRTNRYYSGPQSDHYDGVRFHSPVEPPVKGLLELAWMLAGKARRRWPPLATVPDQDVPPERTEHLRLSSAGHSSILVQVANLNLLIDPVWARRVSPLSIAGPRRAHAVAIAFDDLPPIDTVLITHNHYDHLDGATLVRLWRRFRPRVVAPLGNDVIIRRFDPGISVETYDWGECTALSDSLTVHIEPAFHWSGRRWDDRRMALWCAYVLVGKLGGLLYHVGDTAYGDGSLFRLIRERHGAPDVALLPIGAYEPRWFMQAQHVDPAEAVRIMLDCGASRAFGHHWGTFQLTHEPAEAPIADLRATLAEQGLEPERFVPLLPGRPVELAWGTTPVREEASTSA